MRNSIRLLLLFSAWLPAHADATGPLLRKDVPSPLTPWTNWALWNTEESLCPFFQGNSEAHRCQWPTRLTLALDDRGGQFTQGWRTHVKSWVPLPGNEKRWPQAVKIDGAPAPVALHQDRPRVFLTPGVHTVTGTFSWNQLPESLPIPGETGLLALAVRGKRVEFPNRDQEQVWLQKTTRDEGEEKLEIVVHRKVIDEIPLQLATRVVLSVSGKSREVVLGKSLPAGFVPMALTAPLPVRFEPDSRLRVQVRPGSWNIELIAHSDGPVKQLSRPEPDGPWGEGAEIWVFQPQNELRVVTVEGVAAIDPQQTLLPEEWKRLPTYLMKIGDALQLVEKRRGDSDPPADQLALKRNLWLDFDGSGFSVSDEITGHVIRTWRLEMAPPTTLGRVSIDGRDQFITASPGNQYSGAEVRQGRLRLNADSRIGRLSTVPAVGWNHDFQKVSAVLHLPPGWRLFHASGVDDVPETWIKHWSLLEIFLALITALAVGRLYGIAIGGLSLATFALTFPEYGAPQWAWLAVLAGEALVRGLPPGRLRNILKIYRLGAVVVLLLVTIPFAVQHLRHAIYPALENEAAPGTTLAFGDLSRSQRAMKQLAVAEREHVRAAAEESEQVEGGVEGGVVGGVAGGVVGGVLGGRLDQAKAAPKSPELAEGKAKANVLNAQEYDPKAMVQTGPGIPAWEWRSLPLRWSGPVERSQQLHLSLGGPNLNRVLAFLRIALLAALIVLLLRSSPDLVPPTLGTRLGLRGTIALALLILVGAPRPAFADFPTKEMLTELRDRLLVKPECAPTCASASRLHLEVHASRMRARLEVDASAETAIPLPGGDQWTPEQVLLDGQPAKALLRTDSRLWIALGPGRHPIDLDGSLPARDAIQISLGLRPHHVTATSEGWKLEGLHDDGSAEDNLQLTRIRGANQGKLQALESTALPPFVRVTRTLVLGLRWQAETHVLRLTPKGTAVVLDVPLLAGESVTTPDIRVSAGKALLNLGPQEAEARWQSVLEQSSPIRLVAPKTLSWAEVWRLDVGPVWHVNLSGIPVVHQQTNQGAILPEWRPWVGEAVTIQVERPPGVAGDTLTVDKTELKLAPGLRATDAELAIDLRSSRGGQHALMLPEQAELQSVAIGGVTQSIRQDGREVRLPLSPGPQSLSLKWKEKRGISTFFRGPEVNLGANTVNAKTQVNVPGNRWILFLGGPRLGPAVLFWSLLLAIVLVALALGRSKLTPLRSLQWILLAIGLSQVPMVAAAIVAGWFLFLAWRRGKGAAIQSPFWFDAQQLLIIGWTLSTVFILAVAIHQGLLGSPEMQITGNGSSYGNLHWFQDRTGAVLPRPWIFSVPLMVYRLAMLGWALWLAVAVLNWLRWGWGSFTSGGAWRRLPKKAPALAGPAPSTPSGTGRA